MENRFNCIKCGLCCRHLDKNDLYKNLHDGDGICKYLDLETNLCIIYEKRPILCNIDLSYEIYFLDNMSLEEYYKINYEGCQKIWEINKKDIKRK